MGRQSVGAVNQVDLEVPDGKIATLLGPSGCGKSTTLRCIAGLESADTGRIAFGDRVVFDASAHVNVAPNKRNIGMVFQSYALWPHMTVRKNIGYPLRARRVERETAREWIEDVAALVDCSGLLDRYPAQLSGGQQQRVAVARAVAGQPLILLADEPTGNLDSTNGEAVMELLRELHQQGATICMVTHDPRYARHADRSIHLFDGRVVEEDGSKRAEKELEESGFHLEH